MALYILFIFKQCCHQEVTEHQLTQMDCLNGAAAKEKGDSQSCSALWWESW